MVAQQILVLSVYRFESDRGNSLFFQSVIANNLICKRYSGEIYRIDSWHLLDQLADEDNVIINTRSVNEYLLSKYGITTQQYYNLCVFGNIFSTPKCPICGKSCMYKGKVTGYTSTCNSPECLSLHKSEFGKTYWNWFYNSEENQDYSNKIRIAISKRVSKYNKLHGSTQLNTITATAKRHRNAFIHQHSMYDSCILYLVSLDGKVKYGISTYDNLNMRLRFYGSFTYKILFHGSKFLIAYLEYLIKLDLGTDYISNTKLASLAHSIYKNSSKLNLI